MPGDVGEVPNEIAQGWVHAGIAMEDKSIEPKERKTSEKRSKSK
jgi:hypothetical protein